MMRLTFLMGVVAFSSPRAARAGFVIEDSSRGTDNSNNLSMATGVASQGRRQLTGYVMTDSNIYTARDAWLANPTAAEATYGHISTWETGQVTDMTNLFCAANPDGYGSERCNLAASNFNDDIGGWNLSLIHI